jgi:hypothetical protein
MAEPLKPVPQVPRRDFLKAASIAGAMIPLAGTHAEITAPPETAPSWIDKPMRWAQLTLVEDDPGKFDVNFWLDYFKRTRSDAVCLSAGGCVAFYPTKIPFHHRSPWLKDSDPFGDLVAGCRKLGMVVIARTDPHATYNDVEAAHPDWIAVEASGKRRRHWADPNLWVTCGLGPYNFEFMTEVKKEIASRYKVDAIFINRWDGSGVCFCEHCKKNFRDASGFDIPRAVMPADPAYRAYVVWRQQRLFDLWQTWDRAVRAVNPDSCVIPNTGGGATSSLDMKKIGELAPTLMSDRQARRSLAAPWANGKHGKEYRATMGRKPIVGIFSVGIEEPYRWKDSVQSDAEIRLWVADGVANDLRPWFTKFAGVLHDKRWLNVVEELYRRYADWEKYLRNEASLARVGMVYSQQTAWFYGGEREGAKVEDHTLGWYQALIESRLPFEMVHDRLLDEQHLAPFKTLILPNIAALSEEQCKQLRQFVARGGSVIATYETSLYDEWGTKRKDFGLADLFGAAYKSSPQTPMRNAYLRLEHESARNHPLLKGLEDAPRIIHGVWRLEVQGREKFQNPPVTLIPSYPDLPMEMVYPRVAKTDTPEVYLRDLSVDGSKNGRVVYFPWDIDRTFWEVLSLDHLKLLQNAVDWASNETPPVSVAGPGILDVTAWRQKESMTVHLVNLTNPMMMKGPVRELIPVGPQKIRISLPAGKSPRRVQLLAAKTLPEVKRVGQDLELTVPSLIDHEVVAIDF